MRRKTDSITLPLCISLIVHGLGLSALAWWLVWTTPPPKLAAIDRNQVMLISLAKEMAQLPPEPPPKPNEKKKPPTLEKFQKPEETFHDDSGEHDGTGTANRTNHGDKPMRAPQGYEQAQLMKKDAKKFDEDAAAPASAGKEDDNIASPARSAKAGEIASNPNSATSGNDDPSARTALVMATGNGPIPVPKSDPTNASAPTPSGEKNPTAKSPVAQQPKANSELKEIRGKRAEVSDTESVAFAKAPSLVYEAGELKGRKGFKVQWKQPRYGYASEVDLESLGDPPTVLGAKVDADGHVLNVVVLEGSGSSNIDRDREAAVWDSILEPEKDKDGNVIDDHWTIRMR